MTSKNKGSIIPKKAVAIFPFLLVFSLAILNSCGKSLEEKKREEGKTTLSPKEKLSLAKDMLEIGQISEAKKLFIEAREGFSKDECKENKSCPYCEALWGKYLSDLFGTLDLLSQLLSLAAEQSSQTQQAPRIKEAQTTQQTEATQKYLEELNNLIGQSVENVIGFFLKKVNNMRRDLKEIIDLGCEMKTKAASKFEISTPTISLQVWIPQNPEKAQSIPTYKKPSAYLNYSLLSLIAGVLDIAYSQNYNISLTYTLGFIKELTKEKDIQKVLLTLGDFFANNPKILTLDAERKDLWSKSAADLADFFYSFDNFYKSFCEEKDSSEASKIMIEGLISGLLPIKIDICAVLSPSSISRLFTKWGDGLAQKRKCEVKDGNKIEIAYDFDQDGCIRIPNDLQVLTGLVGLLQSIPQFSLPITAIAFHPGNFFGNPTSLRNFLPLVVWNEKDGEFAFAITKEGENEDKEHFSDSDKKVFTLEYNESISRFGFPTRETAATPILKDCVPGGPLYIAFSDPTFNNSLFITTYLVSLVRTSEGFKLDDCANSWEQAEGLADDTYYKIFDKKNQNYALNKLVNKILSLFSRFLPK
ncbi:MAG: hypothetical protein RRA63_06780 [Candidatus Calescibacterium sp.]|jgi:hypothetical protein|nr:hypothetical protein [Candidatus Calescibacterium sp.]